MKFKLFIFIFVCIAKETLSQNDATCNIDDSNSNYPIDWTAGRIDFMTIEDTAQLHETYPYTGTIEIEFINPSDPNLNYLTASVDGTNFIVETTDSFLNYEEDNRDAEIVDNPSISIHIILKCEGGDTPLTLSFYVTNTNNNGPEFLQPTYEYLMPMPLLPRIDLTNFGDEILVKDIDLKKETIEFSIDPPDQFELTTDYVGQKQYRASWKVKQYVKFDQDNTIQITASDGVNSNTATINVKIDKDNSIPETPSFSSALYEFKYTIENEVPTLTPVGDAITIVTNDPDNIQLKLSDEIYFTPILMDKTITLAIKTPLPAISDTVISLILTATLNTISSSTVILIRLPSDLVVTTLKFSEPYYKAAYTLNADGNDVIEIKDGKTITLTSGFEMATIALQGDTTHFSIALSSEDSTIILYVASDLDEDTLKEGEEIVLILHASITDENANTYEAYATVLVQLPPVIDCSGCCQHFFRGG